MARGAQGLSLSRVPAHPDTVTVMHVAFEEMAVMQVLEHQLQEQNCDPTLHRLLEEVVEN